MIDELPPGVRALISASRSRLGPDAATVARLQTRIHAAVAAGGVAAGTSAVVAKLVVVALAVATVGTVAYMRHVLDREAVAPTIAITSAATDDVDVAPRISGVEREPVAAPGIEPALVPAVVQPLPAAIPRASLTREIELVDLAVQAFHRGEHATVLATIHTYDVETSGHGQLAEDAAAIALESACSSSHPTAATKLATFTQRWPNSAQQARLTRACQQGDPP